MNPETLKAFLTNPQTFNGLKEQQSNVANLWPNVVDGQSSGNGAGALHQTSMSQLP